MPMAEHELAKMSISHGYHLPSSQLSQWHPTPGCLYCAALAQGLARGLGGPVPIQEVQLPPPAPVVSLSKPVSQSAQSTVHGLRPTVYRPLLGRARRRAANVGRAVWDGTASAGSWLLSAVIEVVSDGWDW